MTSKSKLAAEGFKAAQKKIKPPAHAPLLDGAEPYFNDIVRCRAQWSPLCLSRASALANTLHTNAQNAELLAVQGMQVENHRGDVVVNSLYTALMAGERLAIALANNLQVNTTGVSGRTARDASNLNRAALDAHNTLDDHESEDSLLIPGLSRMRAVK